MESETVRGDNYNNFLKTKIKERKNEIKEKEI